MAEQMNIYQKLARIRKQVEVIQKNKSGYGYGITYSDDATGVRNGGMGSTDSKA